ncbi:Ubiquitin-associated domain-containing protein 2 [Varanus komodoensis]|nr:Ubiquitin-associated domain-containing protein 2 [Varanus komodoensis]
MATSDLRLLSWKTVFPKVITSACCASELATLQINAPFLTFHRDKVILHQDPLFTAKVTFPFHVNQDIVLEQVVARLLQEFMEEMDHLNPFQSGFRPSYGMETALVTLYDDLCRERDRGSASLLVLLDLSAAFGEAVVVLSRCLAKISGMCYTSSVLKVYNVLCVPSGVARIFAWTLEPIFSSPEPSSEIRVGMGATVDIQREQRMELLDRQILMSQFAQIRRQRQQQVGLGYEIDSANLGSKIAGGRGGMINWNRLFPPLRHRGNANYQDNHQAEHEVLPPVEVSEEQVARLMEMGFSRLDALEALRASNNDLNIATNFLLQHR